MFTRIGLALIDNTRIAFRALRVNALRSALTALGIIIGVGAVITMVAMGNGARLKVAEQMRSLGSNQLMVLPGSLTSGAVHLGAKTRHTLTEEDAIAINREVPSLVAVAPTVIGIITAVYSNRNWSTLVEGVVPDYLVAREWQVTVGRPITAEENDSAAKVALVGRTSAEKLFGNADPLDQLIRLGDVPFRVVGVLAAKGLNPAGNDYDDCILVPLSTAKMRLKHVMHEANRRSVKYILVKMADEQSLTQAQQEIRSLLRQRHRLPPGFEDDFFLRDPAVLVTAQEASARAFSLFLASVASISLIVGGISIMNIMLVSITERTREIGLRLAVGARRRDILIQFLTEAVTLSLFGGLAGIVIGMGVSMAFAAFAGWPILIRPGTLLFAFGFAVAVGVFFGYYPAYRASCLDPIEALRFE